MSHMRVGFMSYNLEDCVKDTGCDSK